MNQSNLSQTPIIDKFPKKLAVYFSLIFITPIAACLLILKFLRVFSSHEIAKVFSSSLVLTFSLVIIGFLFFIFNYFVHKILAYDGSEESKEKCNKALKQFELFTILTAFLNAFIFPTIIYIGGRLQNLELEPIPIFSCFIGTVFSYSLFFLYLLYAIARKLCIKTSFFR